MPTFAEAVGLLGGAKVIDEALWVLTAAISSRPDAFDIMPPFKTMRVAKSDPIRYEGGVLPPMRLFFRIKNAHTVELLWIEAIPDDEHEAEEEN